MRSVEHAHPKAARPATHSLTDGAPSNDTKSGTPDVPAKHETRRPHTPASGAHEAITLGDAAGRRQHQGEREVGRRFRKHSGGVADGDTRVGGRGKVDIIDANGQIADGDEAGRRAHRSRVETVANHAEDGVTVADVNDQILMRRRRIIVPQIDTRVLGQTSQCHIGDRTRDKDAVMTGGFRWRHLKSRFK
jgi:hypothetical protein